MNFELATSLARQRRREYLQAAETHRLLPRTPTRLRRRVARAVTAFGYLFVNLGEALDLLAVREY